MSWPRARRISTQSKEELLMKQVSLPRLYLLRALYLLVVVGLGIVVWPGVLHRATPWDLMEGVVQCMLAAFSALSLLGLRYPLQMLPLLLWELSWKTIWLGVVAYPLWSTGQMDPSTEQNAWACMIVVIFPFIIPWNYVYHHYLRHAGDRWR
jgi:hypothetical protein